GVLPVGPGGDAGVDGSGVCDVVLGGLGRSGASAGDQGGGVVGAGEFEVGGDDVGTGIGESDRTGLIQPGAGSDDDGGASAEVELTRQRGVVLIRGHRLVRRHRDPAVGVGAGRGSLGEVSELFAVDIADLVGQVRQVDDDEV